mgnify:CR=1 FL=1
MGKTGVVVGSGKRMEVRLPMTGDGCTCGTAAEPSVCQHHPGRLAIHIALWMVRHEDDGIALYLHQLEAAIDDVVNGLDSELAGARARAEGAERMLDLHRRAGEALARRFDGMRKTVTRLHRRCQQSESAALITVDECRRAGVSFGRYLALWSASHWERRARLAGGWKALAKRQRAERGTHG